MSIYTFMHIYIYIYTYVHVEWDAIKKSNIATYTVITVLYAFTMQVNRPHGRKRVGVVQS